MLRGRSWQAFAGFGPGPLTISSPAGASSFLLGQRRHARRASSLIGPRFAGATKSASERLRRGRAGLRRLSFLHPSRLWGPSARSGSSRWTPIPPPSMNRPPPPCPWPGNIYIPLPSTNGRRPPARLPRRSLLSTHSLSILTLPAIHRLGPDTSRAEPQELRRINSRPPPLLHLAGILIILPSPPLLPRHQGRSAPLGSAGAGACASVDDVPADPLL